MMPTSAVADLRLKFAEKPWNETFKLVRRCMDKPRDGSKLSEPLARSLEILQDVSHVSSLNATTSRLEMIAKQQGMGFHAAEATCYLTADLFYLEVVLLPCGRVEDVKVATHGGRPVPSESLLQPLRSHRFTEFSVKLANLYSQYDVPGDNLVKLKLFKSLQCLGEDLQQISNLPRTQSDSDPLVDSINNGRIGRLIAGKEDSPLTIRFFISPAGGPDTSGLTVEEMPDEVAQAAQVTLGASAVTHKLPVASALQQPAQLDRQGGAPVFLPEGEALRETLPAFFLLKLRPAIPMMAPVLNKLSRITDVAVPDVDLQWAPFPKLLLTCSHSADGRQETTDEQDAVFATSLPGGVRHSCILPGSAWDVPARRGTAVDGVPFTHPAHVPALLEVLRRQCVINVLLRSCATPWPAGGACDLHCEVLPESDASFSVTFARPNADYLAVLLVNVSESRQISCTLFGAGTRDPSMNQHLSAVMTRCMSIPGTLVALHDKLTPVPLPPCRLGATGADGDHSGSSSGAAVMDGAGAVTVFAQRASAPDGASGGSGPACVAMSVAQSELHPKINASPAVNFYLFSPLGVFPCWIVNYSQM